MSTSLGLAFLDVTPGKPALLFYTLFLAFIIEGHPPASQYGENYLLRFGYPQPSLWVDRLATRLTFKNNNFVEI